MLHDLFTIGVNGKRQGGGLNTFASNCISAVATHFVICVFAMKHIQVLSMT